MDLFLKNSGEIVKLLSDRLKKERLNQQMTQTEVAQRAGVGVNTVSNLEAGKNVSFENLVKIAMVLGRLKELEQLFQPKLESIDDMIQYEKNFTRQRIKRKSKDVG